MTSGFSVGRELPFDLGTGNTRPTQTSESRTRDAEPSERDGRQVAAARSALWAAWADAVGWIAELTDERGLQRRLRGRKLEGPVAWKRKIGGRGGVNLDLPAGTYSDDTQLRLAVCRSYGSDGFDPEAFSLVELTVWPAYALGGGTGTKTAAGTMAKAGARWSANRPPGYVDSGGNGAAMRVQPHAWHSPRSVRSMLTDVMRDAVSTHGHPYAIVGAALSALAVADALPGGGGLLQSSGAEAWERLVGDAALLRQVAEEDVELGAYWSPNWSHPTMGRWSRAVELTIQEALSEARAAAEIVARSPDLRIGYQDVVEKLGIRRPERRGSGLHTVLAALALVALAQRHEVPPADALLCAATELGTDTDTIASMAGAVLGCAASDRPSGSILDGEYIAQEAARVAAPHRPGPSLSGYPDLLIWEPPRTQSDALLEMDGQLLVSGLGFAEALDEPVSPRRSDFAWQWVRLESSQTLVIKRRKSLPQATSSSLPMPLPSEAMTESPTMVPARTRSTSTAESVSAEFADRSAEAGRSPQAPPGDASGSQLDALESALAKVRSSKYEVRVIGMHLARLAREEGAGVASAFGAVVATELAAFRRDPPG